MNKSILNCPHGHGELREWEGKPRCWTCGYVPEDEQPGVAIPMTAEQQWEEDLSTQLLSLEITLTGLTFTGEYDMYAAPCPNIPTIKNVINDIRKWYYDTLIKYQAGNATDQRNSGCCCAHSSEWLWELVSDHIERLRANAALIAEASANRRTFHAGLRGKGLRSFLDGLVSPTASIRHSIEILADEYSGRDKCEALWNEYSIICKQIVAIIKCEVIRQSQADRGNP